MLCKTNVKTADDEKEEGTMNDLSLSKGAQSFSLSHLLVHYHTEIPTTTVFMKRLVLKLCISPCQLHCKASSPMILTG